MLHQELIKKIIGCAYTVHNTLGAGFLEKVYEQALIVDYTFFLFPFTQNIKYNNSLEHIHIITH